MTTEQWSTLITRTNIERYTAIQDLAEQVWQGLFTPDQAIELGVMLFDNQEEIDKFKSLFREP